jgi:hypothetical protein
MFIYTVRAQTVRMAAVVCVALFLLLGVAIFADAGGIAVAQVDEGETVETVSYSKIRTDEDRLSFLASLGWQTTGEVVEEETFTLPETFDRVLLGYNEIQKDQGLDLSRYRKKKVTRYTYEVTNYEGYEGKVYANLIVWRNRVVAGDISSADPMGFVQGLEKQSV